MDDAEIAALMRQAGIAGPPDDLRDLLDGINAAPENHDWLLLVAPEAPPDAASRLLALRRALAARARPAGPPAGERLAALRARLAGLGVDGFVVPRADEHQGEFVPARAERLAWLTGFTGSSGVAVVLREEAAVFVDGRYTLQAQRQVDPEAFAVSHLIEEPPAEWLAARAVPRLRIAYDPWLHSVAWLEKTRKALQGKGAELVPLERNPIDALWRDQPPPPLAPVVAHPMERAGRSSADKRTEIAEGLADRGADAVVLTAPDSIAWLLNIRGGDVPHTPLPLSFAILDRDGWVDLFVDQRKLTLGLESHLGNRVAIRPPGAFGPALDRLGADERAVLVDPDTASAWVFDRLHRAGATMKRGADPCGLPKARKNAVELAGARAAHRRDGAAVCRFLAWLERTASAGGVRESDAAGRLREFRAADPMFRDVSFETISAAGPNGAIVHYRVTAETDRRLEPGSLYLVDSGAQYLDGTTDITRTLAVGAPAEEMRERFTLVLKGHIAIATARFPKGTTGGQLDALARQFLWHAGLDYDHGTGHGVGSYLGVHEGPQRLSKVPNSIALEPGMIVSNEPGYYKTDAYGIRIENLLAVCPCAELAGADRPMFAFETLTLAPIDRSLVKVELLTAAEVAWVDAYHARVLAALAPALDGEAGPWLAAATAPLGG